MERDIRDKAADTVGEFCLRVGISRRHFYELLHRGEGPATVILRGCHQARRGEDEARLRERGEAA